MAKRKGLAAAVESTSRDPAARVVAASAVAAGGAIAAGKAVREKVAERRRRQARRYRLEPDESPRAGVGRVARGQLELTVDLLKRAARGEDSAEAVHDARKALKRLRALLRVSRGVIDDGRYRRENAILRDAGRELSAARDAQVMLDTLDELRERYPAEVPNGSWGRLRTKLEAVVGAGSDDGLSDPAEVIGLLSHARARVAAWRLPADGGPEVLAEGFARIYRRGRRAVQAAQADPSTENLHELRKRVKDLWHASQLLRPVCPSRMKKLSRRAHDVSDLLGDDHDLAVLLERGKEESGLVSETELELLAGLVERRREQLHDEALKRAAHLYRRKPRKLVRRLKLV